MVRLGLDNCPSFPPLPAEVSINATSVEQLAVLRDDDIIRASVIFDHEE